MKIVKIVTPSSRIIFCCIKNDSFINNFPYWDSEINGIKIMRKPIDVIEYLRSSNSKIEESFDIEENITNDDVTNELFFKLAVKEKFNIEL